jgi:hypothetical protein
MVRLHAFIKKYCSYLKRYQGAQICHAELTNGWATGYSTKTKSFQVRFFCMHVQKLFLSNVLLVRSLLKTPFSFVCTLKACMRKVLTTWLSGGGVSNTFVVTNYWQGCRIFLGTTYQNGEKVYVPKDQKVHQKTMKHENMKHAKRSYYIQKDHKIY